MGGKVGGGGMGSRSGERGGFDGDRVDSKDGEQERTVSKGMYVY